MEQLYTFFIYSALLILVMLLAEFSFKVLKFNTEWTRKIAHIGSGIVALSYPDYVKSHWIVLALTVSFMLILYFSKKFGLFKSIFSVGRKSHGELFFVWSSWLLFWLFLYTGKVIYFYLPFSIVVFADPAAALLGKAYPLKKYTILKSTKSYAGSFTFFLVSFFLTYYFVRQTAIFEHIFYFSLVHAFVLTLVEAISSKGWDNFNIPLVSVLMIYFLV